MTITKEIISKNISKDLLISKEDSKKILNRFTHLISSKSLKEKVKISGFGSFIYKYTPERVGRNPKTNKSYIIKARKKLTLKTSSKLKIFLN